jgi:molybdate transport system substrate-binding protein
MLVRRRSVVLSGVASLIVTLTNACGPDDSGASTNDTLTVFAASSLTGAFEQLGTAFEAANPGVDVVFSFGASSELAAQIGQGAPADVVALADNTTMDTLVNNGDANGQPTVFAANSAEIIVEPGNPKQVSTVADLARDDLTVVLCAPEVPCGRYATSVLDKAGVTLTPASLEQNVKGVVAKVTLGEADAGIVYRTDVIAAGAKADGVAIPVDVNVRATYPIVQVADSTNPLGQSFIDFVLGDAGRTVLTAAGFGSP